MSTDIGKDTHTHNKKNETTFGGWMAKLSLSHWLAIVSLPVGIMGALYLFWQENNVPANVDVYVPAHKLPAYHLIQSSDLILKPYASRSVPSGTLKESSEIVDRYTLTPLPKNKPLTANQLSVKVTPTCLTNTVAVSLPATPAMTFGGNLKAGDIVSITFSVPATKEGTLPTSAPFPNILVLDVKAVSQPNTPFTAVVVIALPETSVQDFSTHMAGATALVSHNLSGKENSCVM